MTIGAKLIVMFPQPKNVGEFESLYRELHTLLAEKIGNKTFLVEAKIVAAPMGPMPHYRITEIHFPTREALETCLGSPNGQLAVLQAVRISRGGAPVFLIAEEQTTRFGWWKVRKRHADLRRASEWRKDTGNLAPVTLSRDVHQEL